MRRPVLLAAFQLVLATVAVGQGLTVIGWNLESGGAEIDSLKIRIRSTDGCHIWGFTEVQPIWFEDLKEAAADGEGGDFESINGSTGGADRMSIVYKGDRFDLLESQELTWINIGGSVRAPLVARFHDKESGKDFWFMVNHLYRSNKAARHQQATKLNAWAAQQTLPVIAVGDYNFDWNLPSGDQDHDAGFDHLTKDGVFSWVRPATLAPTQSHSTFKSVLDFVFVSKDAQGWAARSTIVVIPGDFPDTEQTSDHRPVMAEFTFGPDAAGPQLKALLLQRLAALEAEIAALKRLIDQL